MSAATNSQDPRCGAPSFAGQRSAKRRGRISSSRIPVCSTGTGRLLRIISANQFITPELRRFPETPMRRHATNTAAPDIS